MQKKLKYYIIIGCFITTALIIGMILKRDEDPIDALVTKYNPEGASIAIIENREIKEIRNYGYADKENNQEVTDNSRFKIASISKTITAYAVMQLVEENRLNLDTPVNEYLTKWKVPESKYGEDGVTLRTLMSHTAGITGSSETNYTLPLPRIEEALYERNIHLKREPGTVFEYSEFAGFGICQLVIEEVTGMSFEEYMETEVFRSLEMTHTDYSNVSNEKGPIAVPYAGTGNPCEIVPIVMNGAGGVSTTSENLARFGIALMDYYDAGSGEMFLAQKNTESTGGTYGLGIIPRELSDGRVVYEHNGTLTGWNAQLAIEPESGSGIAVVTNSDKAFYLTYAIMEEWSKEMLGESVSDSLIKQMYQQVILGESILLTAILLLSFIIIRKIKKQRLIWNGSLRKTVICSIAMGTFMILIYLLFYTEYIFKILWGMENYYLFTFFPPVFIWVPIELCILFMLLFIRIHLRKRRRGKYAEGIGS